jgi:penicillin G amidase
MKKFCLLTLVIIILGGCASLLGVDAGPDLSVDQQLMPIKKPIEIIRDENGVPHIFAETEKDIFFAVGWVSAQDRLFQMELFRRMIAGRLGELFGEFEIAEENQYYKSIVARDIFHRTIGFRHFADRAIKNYPEEDLKLLQNYCDGVNTFIERYPESLPWELGVLDIKVDPWVPADMLMISRFFGWTLGFDWSAELIRAILVQRFGEESADEIFPFDEGWGPTVIEPEENPFDFEKKSRPFGNSVAAMLPEAELFKILRAATDASLIGIAGGMPASNSWVVSGIKTKSGKPIMSNDPHLMLNLPSLWYAVHIKGANYDVSGMLFPGTPMVILGHNRYISWGATTPFADVQDIFIERPDPNDPTRYLTPDGSKPFTERVEQVKYKTEDGMKSIDFIVRSTDHGPIINSVFPGVSPDLPPLALSWTGYRAANEFGAFRKLAKARNWDQFIEAFTDYGLPVQNWVYADVEGNIGYIAAGDVPVRKKGDGSRPVPGWTGEYDWTGRVPLEHLPQVFNPAKGYIATANNRVVRADSYPYHFSHRYLPGYRAASISEALEAEDNWDLQSTLDLQRDTLNLRARRLLPTILAAVEKVKLTEEEQQARALLQSWDYRADTDNSAQLIFAELMNVIEENIYPDDLGDELFDLLRRQPTFVSSFDSLVEKASGALYDDLRTRDKKETAADIFVRSFKQTVHNLDDQLGGDPRDWHWGRMHIWNLNHPFALTGWPLSSIFGFGPYQVPGGTFSVYAMKHSNFLAPYKVILGPSMRHIVDMGDVGQAGFIYPGGQSGAGQSPHFSDMIAPYLAGKLLPMHMDQEKIHSLPGTTRQLLSPEIFENKVP